MSPRPPSASPAAPGPTSARGPARADDEPPPVTAGGIAFAVAWFLALAVAVTLPASLRPSERLIGLSGSDAWEHAWGQWWRGRELAGGEPLPVRTELLGHPTGGGLWDPDLWGGLLSAALQPLVGWPSAYGLTVVGILAVNGLAAAALAREEGASPPASLAAGSLVLAAPYGLGLVANGIVEQAHLWALCLFLLAWGRYLRRPDPGPRAALWLSAGVAAVANVYFAQFAAVAALALMPAALGDGRGSRRRRPLRLLLAGALPPVLAAAFFYVPFARHLADPSRLDFRELRTVLQRADRAIGAPLADVFTPPGAVLHAAARWAWWLAAAAVLVPLLLRLARERRVAGIAAALLAAGVLGSAAVPGILAETSLAMPAEDRDRAVAQPSLPVPEEVRAAAPDWLVEAAAAPRPVGEGREMVHPAYLGLTLPLLALTGACARRRARRWGVLALIGLGWSFGPRVVLPPALASATGLAALPSPYLLLFPIPPFDVVQFPYRAHALALMGAAVAAAHGVDWLRAGGARTLALGAMALVALEIGPLSPLPWPVPSTPFPEREGLAVLGADPEPGAVLELPFYQEGEVGNGYALLGQTLHGRPLPNAVNPLQYSLMGGNGLLRLLDLGLNTAPSVLRELRPEHVVAGIDALRAGGWRFVVVRDDLPYSDAALRAPAVARVLEEVVGWRPLAERPKVYRISPVAALPGARLLWPDEAGSAGPPPPGPGARGGKR